MHPNGVDHLSQVATRQRAKLGLNAHKRLAHPTHRQRSGDDDHDCNAEQCGRPNINPYSYHTGREARHCCGKKYPKI
jgi:hypothetical protein